MKRLFLFSAILALMFIAWSMPPIAKSGRMYQGLRAIDTDSVPDVHNTTFTINMNEGGFIGKRLVLYVDKGTLTGTGTLTLTAKGYWSPDRVATSDRYTITAFSNTGISGMAITYAPAAAYMYQLFTGSMPATDFKSSMYCVANFVIVTCTVAGFTDGPLRVDYAIYED